ncbi:MAG: hypothetical protein LBU32_20290 [Clostridiales bacterium]|nr:hypothetical protein [Clostridiales bacterium]
MIFFNISGTRLELYHTGHTENPPKITEGFAGDYTGLQCEDRTRSPRHD